MPPIWLDHTPRISLLSLPRAGIASTSHHVWLLWWVLRIEFVSSCVCCKYFTGWAFGYLKGIFPANFRIPEPEPFPPSILICWFISFQACDKDSQCGGGMCCAVSIWVKSIRICTPMGQVGDSCHPLTRKVSVCTGTSGLPSR